MDVAVVVVVCVVVVVDVVVWGIAAIEVGSTLIYGNLNVGGTALRTLSASSNSGSASFVAMWVAKANTSSYVAMDDWTSNVMDNVGQLRLYARRNESRYPFGVKSSFTADVQCLMAEESTPM